MAEKIKYTRKDLKSPDEFLSAFSRAVEWTRENRTKVLAGVLGILLAVGGVFGAQAYYRWEENKATRALWPHLNRAREFLQAPQAVDAEKLMRLEQFLTAHVNSHPGTAAAVYARYYLGSIAFLRGDYSLSEAHYRAAIRTGKAKEIMPYLLGTGLAHALEAKGDYAAAAAAYRDAAGMAGGALKTQAQIGQARSTELAGKKQEAVALYRQILSEAADPQIKEFVELKLARAE
ncbi:MAG: tetratricopeptide repeat protein [Deltaproteobacteria bacterium]|nr:tetratricopeptide repeat protein [Deltaproteobacteria bacterium]